MDEKNAQLYQGNLAALRARFPALAGRIEAQPEPCGCIVIGTPSGFPALIVPIPGGEQVLYHSRHDPKREAIRWAESPGIRDSSRMILFGLGLGYHALALLMGKPRDYLCIVEPRPDILRAAMEWTDLRPILNHPNVFLLCGEPPENLYRVILSRMGEFLSTGFDFYILPPAARACPDDLQQVQREMERVKEAYDGMLRHMETTGLRTQEHLFRNIPAMYRAHPPSVLKNKAVGCPALIVAAGPSLNKNIDQIVSAVGHAAIFAVDTSLRLLQARGIEPHFVVTKDPSDLNERHFEGIEDLEKTLFVFDPQVSPRLTEKYQGASIFLPHRCRCLHRHLPGRHLVDDDLLPFSQTVALAAFHLARLMGCTPIIFVGLDLAFPPGSGSSHAAGTALEAEVSYTDSGEMVYRRPEGNDAYREQVEMVQTPGVDGGMVPTSPTFYECIRFLEGLLAETGVHCVDATEGGARIEGTEIIPFSEALERYMRDGRNVWGMLDAIHQVPLPKIPGSLLMDLAGIVEDAVEKSHRGLEAISNVSVRADPKEVACLLDRLQAIREEIEQGFRLYEILELALERLFVTIRAPGYFALKSDLPSQLRLLDRYVHYFSEIHRVASVFGPLLREMGGRESSRIPV
ncbi:MAG TPA: DUF115 domain-containing protein [bacterium]|nr:DUF115 domain-containing protein [bacterium]